MVPGIDYLGGAKYIDTAIAVHPKGWAAGFIYDVDGFGNAHAAIDKFCSKAQPSSVRAHMMWRDDHKFENERLWPTIVARAKKFAELSAKYPHIQFFCSPALEHRLPAAKMRKLIIQVQAVLPAHVRVVNSYISGGQAVPEVINEVHGDRPGKPKGPNGYFVSYDGTSMFNKDVEAWKKRYADAHILFSWEFRNNLRQGPDDKTPRAKRRTRPSKEYLLSQIRLMKPKGTAPRFKFTEGRKIHRLVSPSLLKSHAEDEKGISEGRCNRLLFIIPQKVSEVSLVNWAGNTVGKAKYYSRYERTGHRYYFSGYGYQYGETAAIESGSEWVVLKVGNEYFEPVNPAFRKGSFQ